MLLYGIRQETHAGGRSSLFHTAVQQGVQHSYFGPAEETWPQRHMDDLEVSHVFSVVLVDDHHRPTWEGSWIVATW